MAESLTPALASLTPWRGIAPWRRVLGNGSVVLGAGVLSLIVLAALLAPWLAPHDPFAQDLFHRRAPPIWYAWLFGGHASWAHPLGTDKLGRDYLSRLLYGARISLLIGAASAFVSGVIGTTLGVLAGYLRGYVDLLVTFVITTRLSLPVALVALVAVSLYGNSLRMLILVIGLLVWDRFAVVTRTLTLQIGSRDYIAAARVTGSSTLWILAREILPNLTDELLVIGTLEMAGAILLAAALSFLGLGVPAPAPDWGLMLAQAQDDIFFHPWMITQPGMALFVLVLAINVLGDGLHGMSGRAAR